MGVVRLGVRLGERGCHCLMRTEPQAIREAKRARSNTRGRGLVYHVKDAPRMTARFGVWWDPNETEREGFDGKTYAVTFRQPGAVWLMKHDFFMSDAVPREPACHHYCEVNVGDLCHRCKERVKTQWSGISCPCGHTWYCA